MITITRLLRADVGHRLLNHEGKCRYVHGHSYTWEVTCHSPELDAIGRVIDFSVIKEKVGGWIDANLDHAFVCQDEDPILSWLRENGQRVLVVPFPPTAEHLARYVGRAASDLLFSNGISVVKVRCWETPNCFADWTPEKA